MSIRGLRARLDRVELKLRLADRVADADLDRYFLLSFQYDSNRRSGAMSNEEIEEYERLKAKFDTEQELDPLFDVWRAALDKARGALRESD
jgi:hypothetical protein